MIQKSLIALSLSLAAVLTSPVGGPDAPTSVAAADPVEPGRFVWHDLMSKDVSVAKRFYGELLGWRFEDTKRNGRSYVLARMGEESVAGFVDVSAIADAGPQWISFMSVDDVDKTVALVESNGGKVLLQPRDVPSIARAAVVADPQGAPLGLAQLRRTVPDRQQPVLGHFFWQEYLARDATQALAFYKRIVGYDSKVTDTQLDVEYHVLRKTRGHAGLFQLPATTTDIHPNWLPYVLVTDPAGLAARAPGLGGRILVPSATERRNGTLVVIADPDGAPLALQKYPF